MFTRSPVGEPMPPEPLKNANASPSKPPRPRSGSTEPGKSVISNDLRILGQDLKIISRGALQVDGEIEGDAAGAEIIIGEQGKVTGTVAAERVIVRGRTSGSSEQWPWRYKLRRAWKATSTTCRWPSNRAPSSMGVAAASPAQESYSSIRKHTVRAAPEPRHYWPLRPRRQM